jgi:hypothetical protein
MYALTNVTSLAIPFILKDVLLLSPAQVSLLTAVAALPGVAKPICSVLVPKQSRPGVLIVCGLVQSAMYVSVAYTVATGAASVPIISASLVTHSIASSIGMAIRDAMIIESASSLGSDADAHSLFADLGLASQLGLVPVSYLSGYLLGFFRPEQIIGGAAIVPALVALGAVLLNPRDFESDPATNVSAKEQMKLALSAVAAPDGLMRTTAGRGLFLSIIPSYVNAMFFYYTQQLGLSAEFLGRYQLIGALAGMAGNGIVKSMVNDKSINIRTVSNYANLVSVPLYFSLLLVTTGNVPWVAVHSFLMIRHFVVETLNSVASLPSSVQLMRTAPKGAEAAYITIVGTMGTVGGVVNSVVSSSAMNWYGITGTDFTHINAFLATCLSGAAAGIPLLWYYDEEDTKEAPTCIEIDEAIEFTKETLPLRESTPFRE